MNSHFWFDKLSNGNLNTIRGRVVYPNLLKDEEENKEIRIEGANYELEEEQIILWLQQYGQVQSDIEEEAIILQDGVTGEDVVAGTGVYLVKMKLKRLIPNVVPMKGKKIRIWYSGVKKQCNICLSCHKQEKETRCQKKSFEEYTKEFKEAEPEPCIENKNENTDIFSFLESLEEKEEDVKQEMEMENSSNNNNKDKQENDCSQESEGEINNNGILTEDMVDNWSVMKMEKFLQTFTPTEEEASWIKTATKNIPCEAESEVLPYFKTIVKKRLVSRSGCLGP